MPSIVEGTIGLELATDNKGSQEAYQVDNQPRDKRAGVKTAVKTGLNASDSRPSYDARNLPKQAETSLTVRTGLQEVPNSVRQQGDWN